MNRFIDFVIKAFFKVCSIIIIIKIILIISCSSTDKIESSEVT